MIFVFFFLFISRHKLLDVYRKSGRIKQDLTILWQELDNIFNYKNKVLGQELICLNNQTCSMTNTKCKMKNRILNISKTHLIHYNHLGCIHFSNTLFDQVKDPAWCGMKFSNVIHRFNYIYQQFLINFLQLFKSEAQIHLGFDPQPGLSSRGIRQAPLFPVPFLARARMSLPDSAMGMLSSF